MAFRNKQTVEDKSEYRTSLYRRIQEKKEIIPDFVFDGSIEIRTVRKSLDLHGSYHPFSCSLTATKRRRK